MQRSRKAWLQTVLTAPIFSLARNRCAELFLHYRVHSSMPVLYVRSNLKCSATQRMETGNWRKGKMIGSKDDRMNPRIGCGLQQLLAGEIPT